MAHRTAVLNVVGLSPALLRAHAPRLAAFASTRTLRPLAPVLPAVTCTVQASMLTGSPVAAHGVVANGWYDRERAEVAFWKQSNRLVRGEKVWETARARDASVTCANLFWWFNMYSSVDVSVTPRPMYKADGRKIPDVYTDPPGLRDDLQARLGRFPLFRFWGPAAGIESSRWIADAAQHVHRTARPTLLLVYLPHLDYDLQRFGPDDPRVAAAVAAIDAVAGDLIDALLADGVRVMIVSEYGIERVTGAVAPNLLLRAAGLLRVRVEDGRELLDPGASAAFAVADHQVAHVYVRDPADAGRVRDVLAGADGVDEVLDAEALRAGDLACDRSGELVAIAARGRWFSYDWWDDDARAPDYARTVDIHRKPGYDPRELFVDPALALPKLAIGLKLLRRKLGSRTLLDVIPLDASVVRGSHGRTDLPPDEGPLVIADRGVLDDGAAPLPCAGVRDVILRSLFDA